MWALNLKGGSSAATIDAVTGGEGKIFICGSFTDANAIFAKNGVDATVTFATPPKTGGVDMYIAAVDAATGMCMRMCMYVLCGCE